MAPRLAFGKIYQTRHPRGWRSVPGCVAGASSLGAPPPRRGHLLVKVGTQARAEDLQALIKSCPVSGPWIKRWAWGHHCSQLTSKGPAGAPGSCARSRDPVEESQTESRPPSPAPELVLWLSSPNSVTLSCARLSPPSRPLGDAERPFCLCEVSSEPGAGKWGCPNAASRPLKKIRGWQRSKGGAGHHEPPERCKRNPRREAHTAAGTAEIKMVLGPTCMPLPASPLAAPGQPGPSHTLEGCCLGGGLARPARLGGEIQTLTPGEFRDTHQEG